ncbi:hypothetical protein HF325_006774, partial [Metschnikowia pulcherrima]
GGLLRAHKEEKFQLHDEADLVNFRADALTRFITNQDLMDNVTLKLIHTSRLAPPKSFPGNEGKNKLYEEDATDEAIMEAAKNMTPTQLFSGDLPLMRAKEKLLARELAELHEELEKVINTSVLSEKSNFQKRAYTFDDRSVKKYSLPLGELDPDADLKLASCRLQSTADNVVCQHQGERRRSKFMAVPRIPGPHSEMLDLSNGMPIEQPIHAVGVYLLEVPTTMISK